jgi:hypothetical protein
MADAVAAVVLPVVQKHGDAGTAVAAMTACMSVAAFCAEQLPAPMRKTAAQAAISTLSDLLR